jgi:hypothetical protein
LIKIINAIVNVETPANTPSIMLIKFSGQIVDEFYIPSFILNKGDIVIIQLPNGMYFRPVELKMIDMLTGKQHNDLIEIKTPLKYVEHIAERSFWYRLFPMTVGGYLDKYANKSNSIYKTIYTIKWITSKTKINTLAGNPRRQLSLYTTLSWTNNIIFDLAGVDPQGGQQIYNFVKTIVQSGGSAILFDCSDEFKDNCTTFIKAKYLDDPN